MKYEFVLVSPLDTYFLFVHYCIPEFQLSFTSIKYYTISKSLSENCQATLTLSRGLCVVGKSQASVGKLIHWEGSDSKGGGVI